LVVKQLAELVSSMLGHISKVEYLIHLANLSSFVPTEYPPEVAIDLLSP
jgi:hypothetical protein